MKTKDESEIRELKFVVGFIRTLAVLLILLLIGAFIGPGVDSQAPPPDKIQNGFFAILAIGFVLSSNRIVAANAAAFWFAGLGCLCLGCTLLYNVMTGRGSITVEILIACVLFVVPTILFRNRHLLRKSPPPVT